MAAKPTRFQQTCPRKLDKLPATACPLAVESIEAIKAGQPEKVTCPFFVNDLHSNYCFWKFMDEDGEAIDSARRLAQLNVMQEAEVKDIVNRTGEILFNAVDAENLQLFKEAVYEAMPEVTADIYTQESWVEEVIGAEGIPQEPGKPGRKKKVKIQAPKGFSGGHALHKSGKRTQLTGLSSKWHEHVKEFQKGETPIRMSSNTMAKKKKEKDEKDEDA
jgi:hypothetical protein